MEGQLYKADRALLLDTVIRERPRIVFEVGTWFGGGSTLSIAKGLGMNEYGKLYTIEMIKDFHNSAKESYKKEYPDLLPYVEFLYGDSMKVFPGFLSDLAVEHKTNKIVDILFLDGCGTKSLGGHKTAFQELKLFEKFMKPGGIFMMHDWRDAKAELVRPYIASSNKWKVIQELNPPESIGFGKVVFKG